MTIILTNLGPGDGKIEVQGRNARGHYEQKAEYELKAGSFKSLTLAEHDSFQYVPAREPKASDPPQGFSENIV